MLRHALSNGFPTGPWTPYSCLRCEVLAPQASRLRGQRFQTLISKKPPAATARTPRSIVRTRAKSTSKKSSVDGETKSKPSDKVQKVGASPSKPTKKSSADGETNAKPSEKAQKVEASPSKPTKQSSVDGEANGTPSEKVQKVEAPLSKPTVAKGAKESTKQPKGGSLKPQRTESLKRRIKTDSVTPRKILSKSSKLRKIKSTITLRLRKSSMTSLVRNIQTKISADLLERLESKERRNRAARERRTRVDSSELQGIEWHEDVMKTLSVRASKGARQEMVSIEAGDVSLKALDVKHPPVPRLAHGLDRVLFNPGVVELRDLHSRVYNFDPYLEKIVPVNEFDFSTIKQFTTASKDPALADVATKFKKKFVGSSSSMTGLLKHFHYLLSAWRPPTLDMMSSKFPTQESPTFTKMQRGPESGFLRWRDGAYALDSDKEYDTTNILSLMGQYMEKLLTVDKDVFERHRIGKSHTLSDEDRATTDSYHYSTLGDFVMRSQLDAYNPKLPGTGMFDLKTRTVLPIRMSMQDHKWGMDYELKQQRGELESFEREYYDMIRATLLKYSLQVRIGRMDGIFVAYHNIARIFGFQYISLEEIDYALHGQREPCLGDREFTFSLKILNDVLNKAVEKYPEQSMRIHVETRPKSKSSPPYMYIFMEPLTEDKVDAIQNTNREKSKQQQNALLGLLDSEAEASAYAKGEEQTDETSKSGGTSASNKQQIENVEEQMQSSTQDGSAPNESMTSEQTRYPEPLLKVEDSDLAQQWQTDAISREEITSANAEEMQKKAATDESIDPTKNGSERRINDTSSPADVKFLTALEEESHEKKERGPLLGMVLTVKSTVNGKFVTRPRSLEHEDEWKMEYSLAEIEKLEQAWNFYEACKRRRYALHVRAEAEEGAEDDFFIRQLKQATERSRLWRRDRDEKDKGKPIWMWNDEVGEQPSSTTHEDLSSQGVSVAKQGQKPQQDVIASQKSSTPQRQDSQPGMISKSGLSNMFGSQVAGRLLKTIKKWGLNSSQPSVEEAPEKPVSGSARASNVNAVVQNQKKPVQLVESKMEQPAEQRSSSREKYLDSPANTRKITVTNAISEASKDP